MTDPAADHQAAAAAEYRTKPAALILKPYAVDHLNWLLGLWEAEVTDQDTQGRFIADEIKMPD